MLRLINDITEFIFVEDEKEACDLIIVPGSDQWAHVEKAALMYHNGLGRKILVCGRYSYTNGRFLSEKTVGTPYEGEYETEAAFCKHVLLEKGVTDEDILCEDQSTNTFENAIFARRLAEEKKLRSEKIMLCCQAFHARRALMTFERYFQQTKFVVVPTVTQEIDRATWFKSPRSFKTVMGELEKCGAFFNDMFSIIPGNDR